MNPRIRVIQVSATTGQGMDEWLQFLRDGLKIAAYAPPGVAPDGPPPRRKRPWATLRSASA